MTLRQINAEDVGWISSMSELFKSYQESVDGDDLDNSLGAQDTVPGGYGVTRRQLAGDTGTSPR